MSKWTKLFDWQLPPKAVNEALPVCPICKRRSKKEVFEKLGWTVRGYRIVCNSCGAEWEYITSTLKDMFLGIGASVVVSSRIAKIANDESIWILRKTGGVKEAEKFLDKEINFSTWKQMVKSFCGKCGNPLAEDEKFCPKCGAKRE